MYNDWSEISEIFLKYFQNTLFNKKMCPIFASSLNKLGSSDGSVPKAYGSIYLLTVTITNFYLFSELFQVQLTPYLPHL